MINNFSSIFFIYLLFIIPTLIQANQIHFVTDEVYLKNYQSSKNIMVASTGRSGSTMLTETLYECAKEYLILKTHILPPAKEYKNKIVFIFSNPDKAAESILHITLKDDAFGFAHFFHVKTSDPNWLLKIGSTSRQTLEDNLLAYDALGCYTHLVEWLYNTIPSNQENAQIMTIKYENLWDTETIEALKKFFNIQNFILPPKQKRGHRLNQLSEKEMNIRKYYNLGTEEDPIYSAYDNARYIWKVASPIQYFNLR